MVEERFGFKKIITLDRRTPLIATLKLCGKTNEDRLVGTKYETSGKYGTFRCSEPVCVAINALYDNTPYNEGYSAFNKNFKYTVGETIKTAYDDNSDVFAQGIHYYLHRESAIAHCLYSFVSIFFGCFENALPSKSKFIPKDFTGTLRQRNEFGEPKCSVTCVNGVITQVEEYDLKTSHILKRAICVDDRPVQVETYEIRNGIPRLVITDENTFDDQGHYIRTLAYKYVNGVPRIYIEGKVELDKFVQYTFDDNNKCVNETTITYCDREEKRVKKVYNDFAEMFVLATKIYYKDDKMVGAKEYEYNETSKLNNLIREITYSNGDIYSHHFSYSHHDGRIINEYHMLNNEKHGVAKLYNYDGKLQDVINFANGQKNGVKTTYDENEKVISTEMYVNDVKQGLSYYFDDVLVSKIMFEKDEITLPFWSKCVRIDNETIDYLCKVNPQGKGRYESWRRPNEYVKLVSLLDKSDWNWLKNTQYESEYSLSYETFTTRLENVLTKCGFDAKTFCEKLYENKCKLVCDIIAHCLYEYPCDKIVITYSQEQDKDNFEKYLDTTGVNHNIVFADTYKTLYYDGKRFSAGYNESNMNILEPSKYEFTSRTLTNEERNDVLNRISYYELRGMKFNLKQDEPIQVPEKNTVPDASFKDKFIAKINELYGINGEEFCRKLKEYECIVVGSVILNILNGTPFDDIDIHCLNQRDALYCQPRIEHWLFDNGFTQNSYEENDRYEGLYKYIKNMKHTICSTIVQVVPRLDGYLHVYDTMDLTICMNYFDGENLYVAYPNHVAYKTFDVHVPFDELTTKIQRRINKYVMREYQFNEITCVAKFQDGKLRPYPRK